jgi:hypothetical protein
MPHHPQQERDQLQHVHAPFEVRNHSAAPTTVPCPVVRGLVLTHCQRSDGYLHKILQARVYDVCKETDLQVLANQIR